MQNHHHQGHVATDEHFPTLSTSRRRSRRFSPAATVTTKH